MERCFTSKENTQMSFSLKPFVALALSGLLVSGLALAEEAEQTVEVEEISYTEDEVIYSTPETDYSSANVWWGNRSVAHDSYIKFERIDVARAPMAAASTASGAPFINKLYFEGSKPSILRPASRAELDKVVAYLRAAPQAQALLRAEGASGDARNEQAIRNYLGENGIPASRITSSPDAQFQAGTVVITYGAMGR